MDASEKIEGLADFPIRVPKLNCPEFVPLGYAKLLRSQTELFAT
jgi:hypothetical protein